MVSGGTNLCATNQMRSFYLKPAEATSLSLAHLGRVPPPRACTCFQPALQLPELPNLPAAAQRWGKSGSQARETLAPEALLAAGQGLGSGCK